MARRAVEKHSPSNSDHNPLRPEVAKLLSVSDNMNSAILAMLGATPAEMTHRAERFEKERQNMREAVMTLLSLPSSYSLLQPTV